MWKYSITHSWVVSCLWKYFLVWKYCVLAVLMEALINEEKNQIPSACCGKSSYNHSEPKVDNPKASWSPGRFAQTLAECRKVDEMCLCTSSGGQVCKSLLYSCKSSIFHMQPRTCFVSNPLGDPFSDASTNYIYVTLLTTHLVQVFLKQRPDPRCHPGLLTIFSQPSVVSSAMLTWFLAPCCLLNLCPTSS